MIISVDFTKGGYQGDLIEKQFEDLLNLIWRIGGNLEKYCVPVIENMDFGRIQMDYP